MPFPTRKAALAAAAALCIAFPFALAACGGGAPAKPTAMPDPAPAEDPAPAPAPAERPDAGNPSSFFPIKSGHVSAPFALRASFQEFLDVFRDIEEQTFAPSVGATLANVLPNNWTSRNFPQFSEFTFGTPTAGIPIQKATATQADRYAAIAYQAVLEHSMLIMQGGVYNYPTGDPSGTDVTAGRLGTIGLSIGNPTTGVPVAGTWTGKAIGFEMDLPAYDENFQGETVPSYTVSAAEAEKHVVTGDVNISVALEGTTQGVSFTLGNWQGGRGNYGLLSSDYLPLDLDDSRSSDHNLFYHDVGGSVRIQFYGPNRQEAGGNFRIEDLISDLQVIGGFAARKQ